MPRVPHDADGVTSGSGLLGPDGRPLPMEPPPAAPKRPRAPRKPRAPRTTPTDPLARTAVEPLVVDPNAPVLPPPSFSDRARMRLEKAQAFLDPLGLGVHGAGFFFTWWRKLGLNWAIALTLGFFVPLSEYSLLNLAMRHGVPVALGDFGVQFQADSWDLHLFGLKGTAHNVRISQTERSEPVLTAREVEFNATFSALFGRLFDWPQVFDSITVRDGELRFERSAAGDWNWRTFIDAVPKARRDAVAAGHYQANALIFDRVRVVYVENIPGGSGNGMIQTTQSKIYFDDVDGDVRNVIVPKSASEAATQFHWKGRSADGLVEISGHGSLFPPESEASVTPMSPPLLVKVFLDNIEMGAYGRMVQTTRLQPVHGTMRGTIDVDWKAGETIPKCTSHLLAQDIRYVANPRAGIARAQYEELSGALQTYTASAEFNGCTNDFSDASAATYLAALNTQTTASAPPAVRQAALNDQQGAGMTLVNATANDIVNRMVGQRLGTGRTGQALQEQQSNAVTKGVKTVVKPFKKLFGGK